ncbi:MAG: hypothetical protein VKJ86_08130 [Synechococcus sp.]|nr:hypothetical protein [Synechococcus sp.]
MKFFLLQTWLRLRQQSPKPQAKEDGFVLPLVFGIGLFMLIVGATMIFRSQDDRTTAIAQKETSVGLGATESGILRVVNFLNQNRAFAQYNFNEAFNDPAYAWQNGYTWKTLSAEGNTTILKGECHSDIELAETLSTLNVFTDGRWENLQEGRPLNGQFRIVDYVYEAVISKEDEIFQKTGTLLGEGTLTLKGRINEESTDQNASDTGTIGTSLSYLKIKIPVVKSAPETSSFPGLWVYEPDLADNQEVDGDILVSGGCIDESKLRELEANAPNGEVIGAPNLYFPEMPPNPQISGNPYNYLSTPILNDNDSFPRATDVYETQTINNRTINVYNYYIESASVQGSVSPVSIKLSGGDNLKVYTADDQMVIFHVAGSVEVPGNASIQHLEKGTLNAASNSVFFQIYGRQNGNVATGVATPIGNFIDGDPYFCYNGSPDSSYFSFGPDYTYGVAGAGIVYGSVWAKQVTDNADVSIPGCASNSNQTIVDQQINLEDLAYIESVMDTQIFGVENVPPSIQPFTEWERLSN